MSWILEQNLGRSLSQATTAGRLTRMAGKISRGAGKGSWTSTECRSGLPSNGLSGETRGAYGRESKMVCLLQTEARKPV